MTAIKQRGEGSLEDSVKVLRERIAKGGKILNLVCGIIRVILVLNIAASVILMIAVHFLPDALKIARVMYEENMIFKILSHTADLSRISQPDVAMIGCFISIISSAVLLWFIHMSYEFFGHLAEGKKPFDSEGALKMRRNAWFMLLMSLYNIALGLISFGLAMLFSFIMEYGGYIQKQADITNKVQEEMIVSFAEITENKSGQTGQHIKRVSEYTRILAEQLGCSPEEVDKIRIASTMHDIGKLMIPQEILEKPGKLTNEEFEIIKTHTTSGGELLKNVEGDEMALSRTIALQHHERVDGKGYPSHLAGEEISLPARIVAVADVYDALTSRRSYKDAWKEEDAAAEIIRGSGTQFDDRVVEAFHQAHDRILEVRKKYRDG